MTRKPVKVSIALIFQTPPSVAAAGSAGSFADRVVERNAKKQFVIPGSQLKGKLRHACEQIIKGLEGHVLEDSVLEGSVCDSPRAQTMCLNSTKSHCLICKIFGNSSLPSSLRFHELVAEPGGRAEDSGLVSPSLRAMVSINRQRVTSADNRLFLVETAPYIPQLRFASDKAITGSLDSAAQMKLLLAGLRLITAWGGMKSRGVGWTVRAEATAHFDGKQVQEADWQEVLQLWNDSK